MSISGIDAAATTAFTTAAATGASAASTDRSAVGQVDAAKAQAIKPVGAAQSYRFGREERRAANTVVDQSGLPGAQPLNRTGRGQLVNLIV